MPGTHRDVVGQPLRDAELPNLSGDLFPVAWLGDTDGCQILTQAEWDCGQQWHRRARGSSSLLPAAQGVLGRVEKDLPYLWGHAADGGDVITSVEEVGSVGLQLELTQPVINGFCILERGQHKGQSVTGAARTWLF